MRILTDREREIVIDVASKRGTEQFKTWNDVRLHLNEVLDRDNATPRTYQEIYKAYLDQIYGHEVKQEIDVKKYQIQDVQRETRTMVRDYARFDTLREALENSIRDMEPIYLHPYKEIDNDKFAVVGVSDWHIGAKHSNFLGEYNLEIAKYRINEYADEVIKHVNRFDVGLIFILNLGDLVEGNIHVSTRIQSEIDVVEQTVVAAELLAQFISKISENTNAEIRYGSVLDNHSRINKNKKEHIEKESFARLIDEFLKLRIPNLHMVGNPVDGNIGFTQINGIRFGWVHGHLDKVKTVKDKIDTLLGITVDYVYIAHRHHIQIGDNVFQLGSLKGPDEYAMDGRLFGKPSQTMSIFDGKNETHINVGFSR